MNSYTFFQKIFTGIICLAFLLPRGCSILSGCGDLAKGCNKSRNLTRSVPSPPVKPKPVTPPKKSTEEIIRLSPEELKNAQISSRIDDQLLPVVRKLYEIKSKAVENQKKILFEIANIPETRMNSGLKNKFEARISEMNLIEFQEVNSFEEILKPELLQTIAKNEIYETSELHGLYYGFEISSKDAEDLTKMLGYRVQPTPKRIMEVSFGQLINSGNTTLPFFKITNLAENDIKYYLMDLNLKDLQADLIVNQKNFIAENLDFAGYFKKNFPAFYKESFSGKFFMNLDAIALKKFNNEVKLEYVFAFEEGDEKLVKLAERSNFGSRIARNNSELETLVQKAEANGKEVVLIFNNKGDGKLFGKKVNNHPFSVLITCNSLETNTRSVVNTGDFVYLEYLLKSIKVDSPETHIEKALSDVFLAYSRRLGGAKRRTKAIFIGGVSVAGGGVVMAVSQSDTEKDEVDEESFEKSIIQ